MVPARRRRTGWVLLAALAALWPRSGRAFSNVAVGDRLENPTLRTLTGGRAALLSGEAAVSLFVFFRPGQPRSLDALRTLASVQAELEGRGVRFVGVVSDSADAQEVRALVTESGLDLVVLVDDGDQLYGRLGVRVHPVVGLADRTGRLRAYEPYRQINFREIVLGRLRWLLGDLTEAELSRILEPPKATSGSPQAEAGRRLALARQLFRRGNAEKALEWARRSLAVAPSAGAYALAGEVLASQGQCAQALPLLEAALKLNPAEPRAGQVRATCGR
jgi:tetratricopeptide (TPR) repeat protein